MNKIFELNNGVILGVAISYNKSYIFLPNTHLSSVYLPNIYLGVIKLQIYKASSIKEIKKVLENTFYDSVNTRKYEAGYNKELDKDINDYKRIINE